MAAGGAEVAAFLMDEGGGAALGALAQRAVGRGGGVQAHGRGLARLGGEPVLGARHEADADHVAFGTPPKMAQFDFIMDTFVSVQAPEGTDPETLYEQAQELFVERIIDGNAEIVFDGIFDED